MRNRLTFPSGGTEPKYVWDRYALQNNGIYVWDTHNVIDTDVYYWDKYSIKGQDSYNWDKYSVNEAYTYSWNKYDVTETNDYTWTVWKTKFKNYYFTFSSGYELDEAAQYSYYQGYLKFFNMDGTTKVFSVTDMIAENIHLPACLASGYYGYATSSSASSPTHIFSSMYSNIYISGTWVMMEDVRKINSGYLVRFSDTSSGNVDVEYSPFGAYPEYVADTIISTSTTEYPLNGYDSSYNYYYECQNLTEWANSTTGIVINRDSYETLTSTNENAYSIGLYNDYFIEYIGETVEYSKGDYISTVTSTNGGAYPKDGKQGDYWYVMELTGTHYWNVYDTIAEKNLYKYYKYNATTLKEIQATRYQYSTGITVVHITQSKDSEGNTLATYNPVEVGDLTSVSWTGGYQWEEENIPIEARNLAYWIVLDNDYSMGGGFAGAKEAIPFDYAGNYSDSIIDLNNPLDFSLDALENKSMLEYTNIVGIAFQDGGSYLFTPSTRWTRHSDSRKVVFNDVIPIGSANGWIPNNAVTTENNGYYANYISTIKRVWNNEFNQWERDTSGYISNYIITTENPLMYELSTDVIQNSYELSNRHGSPKARYLSDGYVYTFMPDSCAYEGEIGEYIGVTESDITTDLREQYPERLTTANSFSYYYELVGIGYSQGSQLIGEVSSRDKDTYPLDGEWNGNWYVYTYTDDDTIQIGEYLETVESTNSIKYPQNNVSGDYWYIFKEMKTFYSCGSKTGTVDAETKQAYPADGKLGDVWYVYSHFENNGPYKSRWVDEIETNIRNTYPTDGIQGNYWYVYKKAYTGYKLQINDWQIKGGVNYKHNINPEKDFTIGCVSSAEIAFNYDNRQDDFQKYLDADYCDYWTWQPNDDTWRLIGRFWLTDAEYNRQNVAVKAFDAILATDTYVDDFIAQTTYPITLTNFFNNLCQYLGVQGVINSKVVNRHIAFPDNFEAINITARQLFQYIAEMGGAFIQADTAGQIYLTTYTATGTVLDNSQYTSFAKQRYDVEPISGLTVKMNADDLGVSAGDVEANPYIIENNPLFYAESTAEIQAPVTTLYNSIKTKVYRPATVQLLQDFGINCGDIIHINSHTFYVMSKELSASGCKLECFGNQWRDKKPSNINSEIVALRGKTNELFRDLEMTQSTLTDTAAGLQSQITQTADEINLRVTNEVEGLESQITQNAESIELRVTNEVAGLESKITQTANSITSSVEDQINDTKSEIKQTTDSINMKVEEQGELVAQLTLDVDGISARGYVTFTDLAGSGTTVINGDNITTGTINADRINMTGSISWSDLTTGCKNTIASYAGADGSDADVPDYIGPTSISAVDIMSPRIYGGIISAGTTSEGYMKMSSSGMDFKSDTGGNLMGIGFYPGRYDYPYIIFGDGVDKIGTDRGMIKKYSWGMWIGDNDGQLNDEPTGTGLMIDFVNGRLLKYVNGSPTVL